MAEKFETNKIYYTENGHGVGHEEWSSIEEYLIIRRTEKTIWYKTATIMTKVNGRDIPVWAQEEEDFESSTIHRASIRYDEEGNEYFKDGRLYCNSYDIYE